MTNDPLTIIHGYALSSLRTQPTESVQCCVTSPPYWGLRDYGLDPIVWSGAVGCAHEWGATMPGNNRGGSGPNGKNGYGESYGRDVERGAFCECGAWRGCLGLEPTPELYVRHVVEVFRELKRVLRGDGTLWLNLGDSYATGGGAVGQCPGGGDQGERFLRAGMINTQPNRMPLPGLKPKDLVGIPWRVAFALQSDGWYLRSDIIWSKPNPMPESVTDRPTKSHEYIFLLSKSQKYFFDAHAVKEKVQDCSIERARYSFDASRQRMNQSRIGGTDYMLADQLVPADGMRNIRSVWNVSTQPFSGAHFATFPPELIKPCILAGAPVGGTVIDPFAGSGTTGKVAIELGRKAILIEPKAEYVEMIKKRCQTTIGLPLAI